LKKAVLATVGASSNVDRIKAALSDVMQDLVKVAGDLVDDLEDKGKVKAETVQQFLKNVQEEASKRTVEAEKVVTDKVGVQTRKAVKDFGLVTRAELDELLERIQALEEHTGVQSNGGDENRKSRKKNKSENN
jgi:polyhydroxyalkanoate synthesis regulator phasin